MKIPRRLIMKVADGLLEEKGKFTQNEVHEKIKEIIGRQLRIPEKQRITMILRNEYHIERTERDKNNGYQRVYFFF